MAKNPEGEEEPKQQQQIGRGGGGGGGEEEEEAKRLKSIAEAKFWCSNLNSALKYATKAQRLRPDLDGLASMVTALGVLHVAGKDKSNSDPQDSDFIDYYKVLQVEPFSHINTIKKQYKKLALVLHPDKSNFRGCEEAFKLIGEGFMVLSDKIRRKEYDMKLRVRLQESVGGSGGGDLETFWTPCTRCMLLHQFERKYLGHNLVCPSCKMSFEAVEVQGVDEKEGAGGSDVVGARVSRSERLRKKAVARAGESWDFDSRREVGRVGLSGRKGGGDSHSMHNVGGGEDVHGVNGKVDGVGSRRRVCSGRKVGKAVSVALEEEADVGGAGELGASRLRSGGLRRKVSSVYEALEKSKAKRVKFAEETMTLAEMQLVVKQKAGQEKKKMKEKLQIVGEKRKVIEEREKSRAVKDRVMGIVERGVPNKKGNLEIEKHGASRRKSEKSRHLACRDVEDVVVVESDFYDFGRDRTGKSFKKGQVWAIYDEDGDGMPRQYGLIEEVISANPFQVKLCWLDPQSNVDVGWMRQEKMGLHTSCGRFKSGSKMIIKSLGMFSHVVDCERAAREVYRIYPRKGSVWAVHKEAALAEIRGCSSARDECCYDIAIFLTTYSEVHGLSMAYLEKVDGYKTVFKRQDFGCNAIRYLQKDAMGLISHQIPARKLSGDEASDHLKDCWELDPASLPR